MYIDTLGKLTLSAVTATKYSAAFSTTFPFYYGNFLYYTGTAGENFDLVISSGSSFSCQTSPYSDAAAMEADVNSGTTSSASAFDIK